MYLSAEIARARAADLLRQAEVARKARQARTRPAMVREPEQARLVVLPEALVLDREPDVSQAAERSDSLSLGA